MREKSIEAAVNTNNLNDRSKSQFLDKILVLLILYQNEQISTADCNILASIKFSKTVVIELRRKFIFSLLQVILRQRFAN